MQATTIKNLSAIDTVGQDEILRQVSAGISYRQIAKNVGVERTSLIRYLTQPLVAPLHALAITDRSHSLVDDMLDIADDMDGDSSVDPETGRTFSSPCAVQRAKLRIDVRKWQAQVTNRACYGDKATVEITSTPLQDAFNALLAKGSCILPNKVATIDNDTGKVAD